MTANELLARIKGELSFFASFQARDGSFPDPVNGKVAARASANFAYAGALVASAGETAYFSQAVKAMDYSVADYAASNTNVENGPEFELPSLVQAYTLLKASGRVPADKLSQWARNLAAVRYTPSEANGNWSTYAMIGGWLQYRAGLIAHDTAASEIEGLWRTYQKSLISPSTDGLYEDTATGKPGSLSVEAVGRGNLTALIANGYDGPSAAPIAAIIRRGGRNSLLMLDPSGQAPTGGRTSNHLWVDAGYQAINQTLATLDADLAGEYRRGASLTFREAARWRQSDGSFSVSKNHYPASERIGFQTASDVAPYNSNLMASTAEAYQALIAGRGGEQPAPSEIGGYVYTAPEFFAAVFANAGGTQVQIETEGRSRATFGQTWNALGIDRIGRVGWDTRLGPSDGIYSESAGRGVTFAPAWLTNGGWTRLADHPDNYVGTVTTQLATPVLTKLTVVWAPSLPPGPTFVQRLTLTPDGIFSRTTEGGGTTPFGMTFPLLLDDGRTKLTQTVMGRIASTKYPGGTSTQSFLALNTGASLTVETPIRSAYGGLTPVRASGSAGEQDTFIYPSGSGDPRPSTVLASFRITPGGYISSLGWVNGTLYSGRTSAGGYGASISLRGSARPDVIFSKPVKFILQVRDGEITHVEANASVTVTVYGKTFALKPNRPQRLIPR